MRMQVKTLRAQLLSKRESLQMRECSRLFSQYLKLAAKWRQSVGLPNPRKMPVIEFAYEPSFNYAIYNHYGWSPETTINGYQILKAYNIWGPLKGGKKVARF